MYLKALEIQGFKSFPDKTRLNFDQEITAIVGPNGSGKSNISDAILWVMGEQRTKTLRGGKMEDVIFGGTEKRSPMGFAQVSLILDNSTGIFDTENTEVMITRRYYRSGESEYYINREACRLRDINELLMDTGLGRDGYSIIGQGRIAEIVSGKSNERREIFEEAAGISRYRYRKEESERKLARTEENLLRINDKVDELELQVEPLRKQAETAKKYLRLRDELKSAEVSVWMETLDRLHAQAETVNHDYQTAKENLAGAQRELEQLYAASENIAQKMREKDLESERTREQISEAESAAAECESAAAVVRTNLQNSADSIARLRVEVSEQTDRADALQAQIDAQQRRLQEIEAEKAQHAQEIQSVLTEINRNAASSGEAERAYTELLAKESAQSSALAECRTRITLLADKSQELLDQENAVATAAAEAAEHLAALETQQQEKQTAQQQARTACDALRAEQREKAQRLSACEQALTRQQERLSGLTVDLRSTESRIRMLTEMEKDFEGYNRAVKAVMHAAEKGTLRGVRGPVANLIKTGDRYALAIETALGAAAQNIVVDTQSCGAQAIELLRRRETGRATFLPLDTIRPMHLNSVPDQESGYVGVADTLVTCAAAYRNIVSNLLGRTVVAETMKDAIAISKRYDHRYRIVTLDGQLVNAGGSLTGGSAAKGSGILSRANELKRLRAAGYAVKSVFDIIANDNETETVVYTSPDFQPCADTFSEKYHFVGPLLRPAQSSFEKLPGRSLIYISLGTVNNDALPFYRACLAAFGGDPRFQLVLSAGTQTDLAALGPIPENCTVRASVDQMAVLDCADIFLTHCGMNSVNEALYFGVPLVMFPQTPEQGGVCTRVLQLGAGVKLEKPDAASIRKAIDVVRLTPAYREKAAEISAGFRRGAGAKGAAEKILQVIGRTS